LAIGFLLIGPSGLFNFPERVWLILFGFSFFGISYASLIVTNIPLMQEYASQYEIKDDNMSETKKEQQEFDYKTTTGYISGAFNLSFGLGTMLGPLISPRISAGIGYRGFTDLFSGISIVSLLIFITFNILHLCQNPKQLRNQRDPLEKAMNTSENISKPEEDISNRESLLKSYDTS